MPFTPTGYQPQTLAEIIDDINQIFIDVFGDTWNTNASSPNGQFVSQLANIAIQNQNFMVLLTSGLYNPDVATSVWLYSICALLGITPTPATYSTVTCTCSGSAGTLIIAGTQIANSNGDVFASVADGTITLSGTVSIVFQAVNTGPVSVLAGTVNNIINKVYGWDTVTNPLDGVLGQAMESDNDLRLQRSDLLSLQGSASIGSVYAYIVDNVLGVTDVFATENNTGASIVVQGVTLIPYSIYIAVIGGLDTDIAQAIYNKKCPGVSMNGNTTTPYYDPTVAYTFEATYQRPVAVPLQVNISIKNSPLLPGDIITQVKNSIYNNFNGLSPLFPVVKIGQIINVSRFVPGLIAIGAGDIRTLTIQQVTGGPPAGPEIQLTVDSIATLITANIMVNLV
jgi:uncharacterized phage protein gp47/JayE